MKCHKFIPLQDALQALCVKQNLSLKDPWTFISNAEHFVKKQSIPILKTWICVDLLHSKQWVMVAVNVHKKVCIPTLSASVLWAIVLPVLLSLLKDSISAIQFSHCFRTSCLFSQKCLWMTSLKQGVGFLICSSMAHFTVACLMLASYSRELAVPEGVPRERS